MFSKDLSQFSDEEFAAAEQVVRPIVKRILSQAQIEQRRRAAPAGGRALANQVTRDYYRLIGSYGGRRRIYNELLRLAETYDPSQTESRVYFETVIGTPQFERFIQAQRRDYAEAARDYAERKPLNTAGQRLLLELFARLDERSAGND
jgi:hypothetical protein